MLLVALGLVGCGSSSANDESAQGPATASLGEQAEAAFDEAMALCLIGNGIEPDVRPRPTSVPITTDAAERGFGISTTYFDQSILPSGLLGEQKPAPVPTVSVPVETESESSQTARVEIEIACSDQASVAALQVLDPGGSLDPSMNVEEIAERVLADGDVASYRDEATACMLKTGGAPYSTPEEARQYFEDQVGTIGPPDLATLNPAQITQLSDLQLEELAAPKLLDSCGWGQEYTQLLAVTAAAVQGDSE